MATASYPPTAKAGLSEGVFAVAYTPTEIDLRVAAHIRRLSQTRFGSTYALAKKIEADPSTLYKILSGSRGVGVDTLHRLHKVLGISADVFLDDDPDAKFWKPGPDEGRRGRRPAERLIPAESPPIPHQPARRNGSIR